MKRRKGLIAALLACLLLVALTACHNEAAAELEGLKAKYPEYFQLETSDGVAVYVWQMGQDTYRCVLTEASGGEKTAQEVLELNASSLSIEEAKAILEARGVRGADLTVIPIRQLYSDYFYEIDDGYRAQVRALFD